MSSTPRSTSSATTCSGFRADRAATDGPQLIVARRTSSGQQPEGVHRLAEGQSRQGVGRHRRRRQRPACLRLYFQKVTGTRSSSCTIAAARRHAGSGGRPDRPVVRSDAISRCRRFRAGTIKAYAVTPKNAVCPAPDCRPSTRPACPGSTTRFGRYVGAERHAEGDHRQAQRRGGRFAGRPGHRVAAHRARARAVSARADDAASASHAAADRD